MASRTSLGKRKFDDSTAVQETRDVSIDPRILQAPQGTRDAPIDPPRLSTPASSNDSIATSEEPECPEQPVSKRQKKLATIDGEIGSNDRAKGQVRHELDGSLSWYCSKVQLWRPAVYHKDIRKRLIAECATQGHYAYPRNCSAEDDDVTSFHPHCKNWGPDRSAWPGCLFLIEQRRDVPDYEVELWFDQRRIVLDMDRNPLKAFRDLPLTISSKFEGWEMEAVQRIDPRITGYDIRARMLDIPSTRSTNALNMRCSRFRNENGLLAWTKRGGTEAKNNFIKALYPLEYLAANSSRNFPIRLTAEGLKRLKRINRGKFSHLRGGRPLKEKPEHDEEEDADFEDTTKPLYILLGTTPVATPEAIPQAALVPPHWEIPPESPMATPGPARQATPEYWAPSPAGPSMTSRAVRQATSVPTNPSSQRTHIHPDFLASIENCDRTFNAVPPESVINFANVASNFFESQGNFFEIQDNNLDGTPSLSLTPQETEAAFEFTPRELEDAQSQAAQHQLYDSVEGFQPWSATHNRSALAGQAFEEEPTPVADHTGDFPYGLEQYNSRRYTPDQSFSQIDSTYSFTGTPTTSSATANQKNFQEPVRQIGITPNLSPGIDSIYTSMGAPTTTSAMADQRWMIAADLFPELGLTALFRGTPTASRAIASQENFQEPINQGSVTADLGPSSLGSNAPQLHGSQTLPSYSSLQTSTFRTVTDPFLSQPAVEATSLNSGDNVLDLLDGDPIFEDWEKDLDAAYADALGGKSEDNHGVV
ncbi:hypothetical protein MMC13_007349 [Lambiella insularis]|nr:hypothetical protein [Lambiella insularis]